MEKATVKNAIKEALKEMIAAANAQPSRRFFTVLPSHDPAGNALDHGSLNLPLGSRSRGGSIDRQIDKYKADEAAAKKQKAKDDAAKTKTAKAEARELESYISRIVDKTAAKQGPNFNKREATAMLDGWMKWQPEKFIAFVKKFRSENGL